MNSKWSNSPKTRNFGKNRWFSLAVRPWNLTNDLEKQNGTSPNLLQALCIISLSLSLQNGNAQFGSKSSNFCPVLPWKFDGWPWKTIQHLFYATSSSVHWTNRKNNSHRCRLVQSLSTKYSQIAFNIFFIWNASGPQCCPYANYSSIGRVFRPPLRRAAQNGGPSASGRHLGWPHFRFPQMRSSKMATGSGRAAILRRAPQWGSKNPPQVLDDVISDLAILDPRWRGRKWRLEDVETFYRCLPHPWVL